MSASVEIGSDNVYADLRYADAAQMQRKAILVLEISRLIKVHRLTQIAAAQLLGIDRRKLCEIARGRFRSVSETELMAMVVTLRRDVTGALGPAMADSIVIVGSCALRVAKARR